MTRQIYVFHVLQKIPNIIGHLKVDEAMEGRTRKGEAGRRRAFLDHLSRLYTAPQMFPKHYRSTR